MLYGHTLPLPAGRSTVLADLDFETYSEAGYVFQEGKWKSIMPTKSGLSAVGLQKYAEHPSTEILCLWYDLKDGRGQRCWFPSLPFPDDLRQHVAGGGLIAAWNITFEERIWRLVGQRKYGFPPLPVGQLRCDMAKARAHCLPGGLDAAGKALGLPQDVAKMKEGKSLIDRFCKPRTPTQGDPRQRLYPASDPRGPALHAYCRQDIIAEATISARVPDLNPVELAYWQVDQECNRRGVRMDRESIDAACEMLREIYAEVDAEITTLTQGRVTSVNEVDAIRAFLAHMGVHLSNLDADIVTAALADPASLSPMAYRILSLRQMAASASVKKVFAMQRMLSDDGRLHDLFVYHSARTGRDAGADTQPQNLPGGVSAEEMEVTLAMIRDGEWGNLPDPVAALSGCLRGLFIADEGHDFIATDYSSIEAVVAAALAGEQWRLDTFARKEDIYLASVSKIRGIPVAQYVEHKAQTGSHHPDRKVGKVAELASGFGGWVGAWRAFGADDVFATEDELKRAILAWRDESPAIAEMWGGQFRGKPWERVPCRYGLEGAAITAVESPGTVQGYRGITYVVLEDVLYCTLLSGRRIAYHQPHLLPDHTRGGVQLSYMGWNTNPKMGPVGWVGLSTYGGKLFENVVQATARDILVNAAINCERQGYQVILRVHDELVTQRREGEGSVEELEAICGDLPHWARGWPVRAAGGWRGKRYRKE